MITLVPFKGCCGKVKDLELKMPFFSLDLMRFVVNNHHIWYSILKRSLLYFTLLNSELVP